MMEAVAPPLLHHFRWTTHRPSQRSRRRRHFCHSPPAYPSVAAAAQPPSPAPPPLSPSFTITLEAPLYARSAFTQAQDCALLTSLFSGFVANLRALRGIICSVGVDKRARSSSITAQVLYLSDDAASDAGLLWDRTNSAAMARTLATAFGLGWVN
ncbi:hypothetical protein FOA52_013127 [Chlamydomonas sp. UWO 241]|nr:hypothetical protein FOA52_013127 [Chlamydomonas sp. UWO 241]